MNENTSQITKKKKNENPFFMYYLWLCIEIIVAIMPLFIYFLCNYDKFIKSAKTNYSVTLGLIFLVIAIAIIVMKKASIFKGCWGFLIISIIITLLEPVIKEINMICWLSFIGMFTTNITGIATDYWKKRKDLQPVIAANKENTEKITNAIIDGRG